MHIPHTTPVVMNEETRRGYRQHLHVVPPFHRSNVPPPRHPGTQSRSFRRSRDPSSRNSTSIFSSSTRETTNRSGYVSRGTEDAPPDQRRQPSASRRRSAEDLLEVEPLDLDIHTFLAMHRNTSSFIGDGNQSTGNAHGSSSPTVIDQQETGASESEERDPLPRPKTPPVPANFTPDSLEGIEGKTDTNAEHMISAGNGATSTQVEWSNAHSTMCAANAYTAYTSQMVSYPQIGQTSSSKNENQVGILRESTNNCGGTIPSRSDLGVKFSDQEPLSTTGQAENKTQRSSNPKKNQLISGETKSSKMRRQHSRVRLESFSLPRKLNEDLPSLGSCTSYFNRMRKSLQERKARFASGEPEMSESQPESKGKFRNGNARSSSLDAKSRRRQSRRKRSADDILKVTHSLPHQKHNTIFPHDKTQQSNRPVGETGNDRVPHQQNDRLFFPCLDDMLSVVPRVLFVRKGNKEDEKTASMKLPYNPIELGDAGESFFTIEAPDAVSALSSIWRSFCIPRVRLLAYLLQLFCNKSNCIPVLWNESKEKLPSTVMSTIYRRLGCDAMSNDKKKDEEILKFAFSHAAKMSETELIDAVYQHGSVLSWDIKTAALIVSCCAVSLLSRLQSKFFLLANQTMKAIVNGILMKFTIGIFADLDMLLENVEKFSRLQSLGEVNRIETQSDQPDKGLLENSEVASRLATTYFALFGSIKSIRKDDENKRQADCVGMPASVFSGKTLHWELIEQSVSASSAVLAGVTVVPHSEFGGFVRRSNHPANAGKKVEQVQSESHHSRFKASDQCNVTIQPFASIIQRHYSASQWHGSDTATELGDALLNTRRKEFLFRLLLRNLCFRKARQRILNEGFNDLHRYMRYAQFFEAFLHRNSVNLSMMIQADGFSTEVGVSRRRTALNRFREWCLARSIRRTRNTLASIFRCVSLKAKAFRALVSSVYFKKSEYCYAVVSNSWWRRRVLQECFFSLKKYRVRNSTIRDSLSVLDRRVTHASFSVSRFDERVSFLWRTTVKYRQGLTVSILSSLWHDFAMSNGKESLVSPKSQGPLIDYSYSMNCMRKSLRQDLLNARSYFRKGLQNRIPFYRINGTSWVSYSALWELQRRNHLHLSKKLYVKDTDGHVVIPVWSPALHPTNRFASEKENRLGVLRTAEQTELMSTIKQICPWHPSCVFLNEDGAKTRQALRVRKRDIESYCNEEVEPQLDRGKLYYCCMKRLQDLRNQPFGDETSELPSWAQAAVEKIPMHLVTAVAEELTLLMEKTVYSFEYINPPFAPRGLTSGDAAYSDAVESRGSYKISRVRVQGDVQSLLERTTSKLGRRKVFEKWIHAYKLRKFDRLIECYSRYTSLESAWHQMLLFHTRMTTSKETADSLFQKSLTKRTFHRLVRITYFQIERRKSNCVQFWNKSSKRRALTRWKEFWGDRIQASANQRKAENYYLSHILIRWKIYYDHRQNKQNHVSSLQIQLNHSSRTRNWHMWRTKIFRRQMLRRIFTNCLRIREEQEYMQWKEDFDMQRLSIQVWKRFSEEQIKDRETQRAGYTAFAFYRINRLSVCWQIWKQQKEFRETQIEAGKTLVTALHNIACSNQQRVMVCILRVWFHRAHHIQCLVRDFRQYWKHDHVLRKCMDQMKEHARKQKQIRLFVQSRQKAFCHHILRNWKQDFFWRRFERPKEVHRLVSLRSSLRYFLSGVYRSSLENIETVSTTRQQINAGTKQRIFLSWISLAVRKLSARKIRLLKTKAAREAATVAREKREKIVLAETAQKARRGHAAKGKESERMEKVQAKGIEKDQTKSTQKSKMKKKAIRSRSSGPKDSPMSGKGGSTRKSRRTKSGSPRSLRPKRAAVKSRTNADDRNNVSFASSSTDIRPVDEELTSSLPVSRLHSSRRSGTRKGATSSRPAMKSILKERSTKTNESKQRHKHSQLSYLTAELKPSPVAGRRVNGCQPCSYPTRRSCGSCQVQGHSLSCFQPAPPPIEGKSFPARDEVQVRTPHNYYL